MKTLSNIVLCSAAAIVLLTATASRGAEIPWWTFTGGGGIAQHGAVALGGAIGPIAPALSPATGGDYTLTGGFWPAFPGHPQPASPVLTIKTLDGGKALISWPVAVNGFTLEYTTQLGSGIWHPENSAVVDTLTDHTVSVLVENISRCYRLRSE